MSKNIRIRTTPNGGDTQLKIQLNQDFDFLEILSLKISQEDVYRSFYSDYGVVVGRVIMNSGVGVPNARVSVFIPLTDEDAENEELAEIYPYADLQDVNSDGIRYNTLPKDAQGECHTPIGTFPTKRELIDNPEYFEVYQKYYKYTTTTNGSGDFMLFGVPVGNHIINVDVDLSDIGIFSQRPYDFIEQGNPPKLFDSPTKFKSNTNLNNLTQVKNRQVGVNVIPFWGEKESNEIGISRVDIDLNYNIKPKAIFIGSIFGDNQKESVNKNCRPRRKMGKVCEMGEGEGTVQMLRKTLYGDNERFDIEGGRVITDKGTWAYQIPMNLDYMITDEFGNLARTEDTTRGIPTRARVRFKINMDETGSEGRVRTRAKYLVPHNPDNGSQTNYTFDDSTPDFHFRDLYWNKIYTVTNHVARFQKNRNIENRNFIGFKDVDDCVGLKNPLPFNKMDTDFNPLYVIACLIISFIIAIIGLVNRIISTRFLGVRPFCGFGCVGVRCPVDSVRYTPRCKCPKRGVNDADAALDCFQIALALALNVFEFDFYNDWLNGSLYAFLFKYKKKRNRAAKYCGQGNGDNNNYIINTNAPNKDIGDGERKEIDEGVIASYEDELFYKPLTEDDQKFYATDIYNLGAVFPCDWQQRPRIQPDLVSTSYQIPPLVRDVDDDPTNDVTALQPLLFELTCTKVKANNTQSRNIRRICEIGVGLDEYQVNDPDDPNDDIAEDALLTDTDIDNALLRNNLVKLNVPEYYYGDIEVMNSGFGEDDNSEGDEYSIYRGRIKKASITQFDRSFYFYFGTTPNNSALELMNSKYFTDCSRTERNQITILGNVTNISSVGGNDGSIEISIIGGIPEYQYVWYDETETIISYDQNVYDLFEGIYYVIVTDNNGAGISIKKTFIVSGIQQLTADVESRNASTFGEPDGRIIFNSITGGVGRYDVSISGPVGTLSFDDIAYTLTVEGLTTGTYTYIITDNNQPAETLTDTILVDIPDQLILTNLVVTQPNCNDFDDGTISFTLEGGTPDFEITLTDNDSNTYSPDVGTGYTYTYTDLPSGTYSLDVEDNFGVTLSSTITVPTTGELNYSYNFTAVGTIGYTIFVTNTLSGQNYIIENDQNDVLDTFVGTGGLYTNFIGLSWNPSGTQVSSEFGCISNIA